MESIVQEGFRWISIASKKSRNIGEKRNRYRKDIAEEEISNITTFTIDPEDA